MGRSFTGIAAHGGALVDRVLRGAAREAALERARGLPKVALTPMGVSDLELITVGALSPLTGFMTRADYESVVDNMRLANGVVWTIPITLPVSRDTAGELGEGREVALTEDDRILGIMEVAERFEYDKSREAQQVYKTTDTAHPGVARLSRQGEVLLGGDVWLINRPSAQSFAEFRHDPAQTRRMFAARGWRRVVAFQTRNPIHRAHEYIQKTALEIVDGLFLHPLVGETKGDDIPANVRMESYQSLLRDYYPPDRVILGVFPATMRYAGPREAMFHAIARKNYGCTHFIVGRDHAGVGGYYGPYDAQRIFDEFDEDDLGIIPLFFENTFYCRSCGGIVSSKTCPHDPSHHVVFSGSQVRQMLERGEALPPEFTRPEVSRVLMQGLRKSEDGHRTTEDGSPNTDDRRQKVGRGPMLGRIVDRVTRSSRQPGGTVVGVPDGDRRVFIIGLDCADPRLVFDRWRDELPNLRGLMEAGAYGELESCTPPITVPAWSSMLTGKDPGQLGFYGFRNRADYSYDRMSIATSAAVTEPRVWDLLGQAGKQVIMVGVPQTFPVRPVNGHLISCFLTPSAQSQFTYPGTLRGEVETLVGEYLVDVRNFRTEDKDDLLRQIYEMTEKRFKVIKYLMREKPWDFFMFVEMGVDRIHHGFWKFHDPAHPKYEPGNRYESAIKEYYKYIDGEIGQMLSLLDDDTVVLVISDHGAKKMDGGICLNEWLIQEGYLVLKDKPDGVVPLEKCEVDWSSTRAWGAGGYYGRVFLNVQGREPQGVIPAHDYARFRQELAEKLAAIPDDRGRDIGTKVIKPQEAYRECRNIPPDLIVYFGDLNWRSVGSVGLYRVHTFENDTGPDDANHDYMGLYIHYDPRQRLGGRHLTGLELMDVAPTVLDLMGVPVPGDMRGRVIGKV